MAGELDELADRLDTISEELADLAIDRLKGALRTGASGRPADEKRITQARPAVEKAAHIRRGRDDGRSDDA